MHFGSSWLRHLPAVVMVRVRVWVRVLILSVTAPYATRPLRQSPCVVRFRGEKQVAPMQAEPWKALMSMLRIILVAHTRAACGRCAVGQEATEREDLRRRARAPNLL